MIIGVDIDGIIADSEPLYRQTINRLFNLNLKQEDITTYHYEECAGLTEEEMLFFWKTFYREGGWLKIEPVKGIKKLLARLERGGDKIVLVTSRPSDYIAKVTVQWLKEQSIPYSELIFSENLESKHQAALLRGYKFDYFIEDYYKYALDFAQRGTRVLLLDYPWNRGEKPHPNIRRIRHLAEAESILFGEKEEMASLRD